MWAQIVLLSKLTYAIRVIKRPVFDRSTSPPTYVGAVGIDLELEALDNAVRNWTDNKHKSDLLY